MTVAELIAKLRDMPQDAEVLLADWNENYAEPGKFSEVRLRTADELRQETQAAIDRLSKYASKGVSGPYPSVREYSEFTELQCKLANAKTAVILGEE